MSVKAIEYCPFTHTGEANSAVIALVIGSSRATSHLARSWRPFPTGQRGQCLRLTQPTPLHVQASDPNAVEMCLCLAKPTVQPRSSAQTN